MFRRRRTTRKRKTFPIIETTERKVDFSEAEKEAQLWKPQSLKPENYGTVFKFKGKIAKTQPLFLEAGGHRLGLFSFDSEIRKKLFSKSMGETISGIGLLSRYRGQWQFIIEKRNGLSSGFLFLFCIRQPEATDFRCILDSS